MQVYFTAYDPATGRIIGSGHCSEPDLPLNRALYPTNGFIAKQSDHAADYVDVLATPPAVLPRPTVPGFDKLAIRANGTDAARLLMDRPFTAVVDGTSYAITSRTAGKYVLECTATIPARYAVSIDCWPYLPYSAEVVAS